MGVRKMDKLIRKMNKLVEIKDAQSAQNFWTNSDQIFVTYRKYKMTKVPLPLFGDEGFNGFQYKWDFEKYQYFVSDY
jgi:hypothetical protein